MECRIFYSWESDLPNATNRSFIEKALENAIQVAKTDDIVELLPVIDRDTSGVPGSPDIANTIFAKIEQSQVFVCDVSLVNNGSQFPVESLEDRKPRTTPNPNVLIELGYALKALGASRIILIVNTAYGGIELLPFDLKTKRCVTYVMPEQAPDRSSERKNLTQKLDHALRTIFEEVRRQPLTKVQDRLGAKAKEAIENRKPSRLSELRKFMSALTLNLQKLAPQYSARADNEALLLGALAKTSEFAAEFADVTEAIAAMDDSEGAELMYDLYGTVLDCYGVPPGFTGSLPPPESYDFFHFLGHELFVTFVSFLIRENRWSLITTLLQRKITIENARFGRADSVSFQFVTTGSVRSLEPKKHVELLKERHSAGRLGETVSIRQFVEADFFLLLRSDLCHLQREGTDWRAWSALLLDERVPRFLRDATDCKRANILLGALGGESIDNLRSCMPYMKRKLNWLFGYRRLIDPVWNFDMRTIGTENGVGASVG